MFAVWIFLLAASTVTALQCPGTTPPPPSTEATLSRWPYITASAPATATITFGTAEHSFGKGSITWSDGRVWTTVSAESKTLTWYNWDDLPPIKMMHQHRAVLTGLPVNSTICYKILLNGKEIAGGFGFQTAPKNTPPSAPPVSEVNFLAWGDFGVGQESKPWYRADSPQARVRDAMARLLPSQQFLLALGDNAYFSGKPHEYDQRTFLYYYNEWANTPLYATAGNHDYVTDLAKPYLEYFSQFGNGRYYSFDFDFIHFVSVDTEWWQYDDPRRPDGSDMLKWLDNDLANTTMPWTVVFQHKMPWTHGQVADINVTTFLLPMYEKHGVPLVLGGHWHDYERYPPVANGVTNSSGVTYIISGGGGYGIGTEADVRPSQPAEDIDVLATSAAAPVGPAVYKVEYNFLQCRFTACGATIRAHDVNGTVFDTVQLNRC